MKLGDKFELKTFENQVRAYYDDPAIKRNIREYLRNSKNFRNDNRLRRGATHYEWGATLGPY